MRPDSASSLLYIQSACHDLDELTAGKTFPQYSTEKFTRAAAERFLMNIGEAISRIDRVEHDLAETIPSYAQIIAFRNRIAHGYDDVDHEAVWGIIKKHIPILLETVSCLLDEWYAEHPQE
jgi:uncharacterized protein with HEPN domain